MGRKRVPLPTRVNNFGDMLGPKVVAGTYELRAQSVTKGTGGRLLSIGSILHFLRDGDVVWGSGVNGKVPIQHIGARDVRVCAVRGPRTAEVLRGLGIEVPDVFGDPALLLPSLVGTRREDAVHEITSIPNLNDLPDWHGMPGVVDPRGDALAILRRISASRFVVSSSLHGIVLADALGVPCAWMRSGHEHEFKYYDYFEGTGRFGVKSSGSISEALERPVPALEWDHGPLLNAFPIDMWGLHDHR